MRGIRITISGRGGSGALTEAQAGALFAALASMGLSPVGAPVVRSGASGIAGALLLDAGSASVRERNGGLLVDLSLDGETHDRHALVAAIVRTLKIINPTVLEDTVDL